ncbi:MAG: VWA domain-containing protein [Alphaproteobacteria bacterium]
MARKRDAKPPSTAASGDVAAFLAKVAATPVNKQSSGPGRLIFALDATASREPTWDLACHYQAEMFAETDSLGGLEIQLAWYRGFGEFRAEPFLASSKELIARMTRVACLAGKTQIRKVLRHAVDETKRKRVNALVFVGDHVEEDADTLGDLAGQMGLLGVPAFMFHEGGEPSARRVFQHVAKLSGGAYCSFGPGSAAELRQLLAAVAVYAAGGRRALQDYGKRHGGSALLLTDQMKAK